MKTKLITILILTLLIQSCGIGSSPENYFDKTTLNSNLLTGLGAKDFEQYRNMKSSKQLTIKLDDNTWKAQDKVEPYLTTYLIPRTQEDIEDIKNLTITSDTEAMITASINLHEFVLDKYKTDYIAIAKLIDTETNNTEILKAIEIFQQENIDTFWDLHTKLMDVAIPYAETNKIDVSRY